MSDIIISEMRAEIHAYFDEMADRNRWLLSSLVDLREQVKDHFPDFLPAINVSLEDFLAMTSWQQMETLNRLRESYGEGLYLHAPNFYHNLCWFFNQYTEEERRGCMTAADR